MLLTATMYADPPQKSAPKKAAQLPVASFDTKAWLAFSTAKLEVGEIDKLVNAELAKLDVKPAPLTTDEQFIRRVYLDLTGKLPPVGDVVAFVKDKNADKRSKLIDKLLDSDDYARHWGQYWRTVITTRATIDFRLNQVQPAFERWMTEQFKANKKWDEITREMLTAKGKVMYDKPGENAQAFFLLTRRGQDATTEIAAETSRIFLGIQIQCAQCHDHPSDVWKRKQFHEFAAYFGRYGGERPILEEKKFVGVQLTARFGEYRMPDKDNPKSGTSISPRFLDGVAPKIKAGAAPKIENGPKAPFGKGKGGFGKGGFGGFGGGPSDEARRAALADQIVDKNNPWFAAAFTNRMWGEFMGQSFYSPIDDLGPQKDAFMPHVLARIAGSFRGNGYDVKQLIRDIMNSETYQRQIRPTDPADDHLLFATRNPVRMNGGALWQTLNSTLGPLNQFGAAGPKGGFGGFGGRFGGIEAQFKAEFSFDPSTKAEDIEGSISQALILMNNPQIAQKIKASGNNTLARILKEYSDDKEALKVVYLRTLARRPTDRELARCTDYLKTVGNRNEAFEDILWALINSTEFQMKR
jgi:hypothetical protein